MKHSNSLDKLYVVEKIVGRRTKNDSSEYLVRWKGFSAKDDTWEPVENIYQSCSLLIQEYDRINKDNKKIIKLKRDSSSLRIPQRPSKISKITPERLQNSEKSLPTSSKVLEPEQNKDKIKKYLSKNEINDLVAKIVPQMRKLNMNINKASVYKYLKDQNFAVTTRGVRYGLSNLALKKVPIAKISSNSKDNIKCKIKNTSNQDDEHDIKPACEESIKIDVPEIIPSDNINRNNINQNIFFLSQSVITESDIQGSLDRLPHLSQKNKQISNSRSGSLLQPRNDEISPCDTDSLIKGDGISRRRVRTNQVTTSPNYKSIVVRKNPDGFTELWLQSPGSRIKNSFTIQVLQEMNLALKEAMNDYSRLVLISGIGDIFSSGIDLAFISKWTPSIIPSSSNSDKTDCSSNISSTSSSTNNINNDTSKNGNPTEPNLGQRLRNSSLKNRPSNKSSTTSSSISTPNEDTKKSKIFDNESEVKKILKVLKEFLETLIAFPKPIIAGVNGPAIGLGVAILPLCDLVYASDKATFYLPYTRLCQIPEGGTTYSLASLVGMALANDLLLGGRKLSAREAQAKLLVSDVFFPKNFRVDLLAKCRNLAKSSPMALEMIKCILRIRDRPHLECAVQMECQRLEAVWQSPEFLKSVYSFLETDMTQFT